VFLVGGQKTLPLHGISRVHTHEASHNESRQARRWLPSLGKKRGQKAMLCTNLIHEHAREAEG
jgi:hypothetical protein